MKFLFSLLVAAVAMTARLVLGALDPAIGEQMLKDLRDAKLVPDILPEFTPTSFLKITYNQDKLVQTGQELRPEEVVEEPHIWFPAPSPDRQYTLIMFDADAEVPLVRHWISTNVAGNKPGSTMHDHSPLHLYTPYHGPTPPEGTGKHRYVFALYEQEENDQELVPKLEDPTLHRAFFDLNKFTQDNKLKLVAASYIFVEHQDGYDGDYVSRHSDMLSSPAATNIASPTAS